MLRERVLFSPTDIQFILLYSIRVHIFQNRAFHHGDSLTVGLGTASLVMIPALV